MDAEEDDILNLEYDPSEIENIDEDELLGADSALAAVVSKRIDRNADVVSTPRISNDRGKVGNVEFGDEGTQSGTSDNDRVDDDDDEEDDDDKDRSKFHSERSVDTGSQRSAKERIGIPDSLDNVKISGKDAAFQNAHAHTHRRRGGGPRHQYMSPNSASNKVLINPHFQGSVPMRPQLRLAWDPNCRLHLQHGRPARPIDLHPVVSILPHTVQPTLIHRAFYPTNRIPLPNHVSPMMPPSSHPSNMRGPGPVITPMPPLMSVNMASNAYRFGPGPSAMWSPSRSSGPPPSVYRPNPSLVSIAQPSNSTTVFARMLPPVSIPPSSSGLRPHANYTLLPPSVRPSAPKPISDLASPPKKPAHSDDWLNMTEDFLRKTRLPPPFPTRVPIITDVSTPKLVVSRQRQAAADVKRKYRNQNDKQRKPSLVSTMIIPAEVQSALTGGLKSQKSVVEGVDADYLRKLEEQKRLRELLLKQKEQRRALMAKKRQQQSGDSDVVSSNIRAESTGGVMKNVKYVMNGAF